VPIHASNCIIQYSITKYCSKQKMNWSNGAFDVHFL